MIEQRHHHDIMRGVKQLNIGTTRQGGIASTTTRGHDTDALLLAALPKVKSDTEKHATDRRGSSKRREDQERKRHTALRLLTAWRGRRLALR